MFKLKLDILKLQIKSKKKERSQKIDILVGGGNSNFELFKGGNLKIFVQKTFNFCFNFFIYRILLLVFLGGYAYFCFKWGLEVENFLRSKLVFVVIMDSLLFNKKTLFTPILVNLGAICSKEAKRGGGGLC